MKIFYAFLILFLFQNCSFDNKTGIWKNENSSITKKDKNLFEEFETLSSTNKLFSQTIVADPKFELDLKNPIINSEWNDISYNKTNNLKNFSFKGSNKVLFKSKKLTKYKINDHVLFKDNHLITSDLKGNLIVFSINQNEVIIKFNFYKKKHKKIEKYLNLIIENNTIYVSDNIGYLYAFNFKENKLLWAKNYKIPFRGNLKLSNNYLIASNQNNNLYFLNKINGKVLRSIPTEETVIKNKFKNNLALNGDLLLFLNTFGSLYAINPKSLKILWFINLKQSADLNPSNLFIGNEVVIKDDKAVISSNQFTYVININTGLILYKKNFSTLIKPIIIEKYIFLVTKNNFLIAMNLVDGNILFSSDINQNIANFLDIKKSNALIENFYILNNKIYILLKNSYFLKFSEAGILEEVEKLSSKINSKPIFIDGSMLYLNNKNKLIVID